MEVAICLRWCFKLFVGYSQRGEERCFVVAAEEKAVTAEEQACLVVAAEEKVVAAEQVMCLVVAAGGFSHRGEIDYVRLIFPQVVLSLEFQLMQKQLQSQETRA